MPCLRVALHGSHRIRELPSFWIRLPGVQFLAAFFRYQAQSAYQFGKKSRR
ncbi:hypothetical protein GYRE_00806 [Yokenella regensburgei ATCC 49455]|uniref:Uncharacterized protein n=1 Tax=Yokenella regensburgei TaxID=158877 RepID=A0AB38FUJ5_9ENTR|nr:hypothetical protein GYRE_00806 [Yokenella regensburgei ATCC 49455]SQA62953.1 Uncharacterised protein [Yokenella regensburgei]SQB02196.1 Uncharacterised protein [Yokenella regensburgei]SUQ07502.1 Uncharacterised protein [Yokenella regensburgei]